MRKKTTFTFVLSLLAYNLGAINFEGGFVTSEFDASYNEFIETTNKDNSLFDIIGTVDTCTSNQGESVELRPSTRGDNRKDEESSNLVNSKFIEKTVKDNSFFKSSKLDPPGNPDAAGAVYVMNQGTSIALSPLTSVLNDSDPAKLELWIHKINTTELTGDSQTFDADNGVVSIEKDEVITYTPNPKYFGTEIFNAQIRNTCNKKNNGLQTIIINLEEEEEEFETGSSAIDDKYTINDFVKAFVQHFITV